MEFVRTAALLLYGVVFGAPLFFYFYFLPIINQAHNHGVSIQDITLYQLREKSRERFQGYNPQMPLEDQKTFLLDRFGDEHRFGWDLWLALCTWGRQIACEERGVEDCSEAEAVKAAIDRLTANDRKARDVEALIKHFRINPSVANSDFQSRLLGKGWAYPRCAMFFLHMFYPNDDVAYLAWGWQDMWSPREKGEPIEPGSGFGIPSLTTAACLLVLVLLIQRGWRLLTICALGRLLGLQEDLVYETYESDMFNLRRQLLALMIVLPLSCVLAMLFLEPFYVLYFQESAGLYAAVLWNALLGGILVEGLENVISILVIKAGYDPHQIIWDNVLVVLVSVAILLYFQNSWFAIVSAVTLGLSLNLFHKVGHSGLPLLRGATPREDSIDLPPIS